MSRQLAHTQAKARACRQQCRESTASSAFFSDRRLLHKPSRQMPWLSVFLVSHTRGPDTARRNPRPCQKDGCQMEPWTRPTASHAQAWKRSSTRKLPHKTLRSDEEPLLRSGEHLSTHTTWRGVRHALEEQRTALDEQQDSLQLEEPLLLGEEDYPSAS